MIDIKVDVSGEAAQKLKDASFRMAREVDKAILTAAIILEGEIKKKISRGGRSGSKYSRGGKGAIRSAPGEPPKTDTGRLVGSIRHEHSFLTASVGTDVNYAGYLELGTSKMAPRPFLIPTLEENTEKIEQLVLQAMQRTLG